MSAEPRAQWVTEVLRRESKNGDGANLFGECGHGGSLAADREEKVKGRNGCDLQAGQDLLVQIRMAGEAHP